MAVSEEHRRLLERGEGRWSKAARKRTANARMAEKQLPMWRMAAERLGLAEGQAVLDLGCGPGQALETLRAAVGPTGRVVGVDYSPTMLEEAAAVVERNGWDNVELRRVDVSDPGADLERGTYDAAVASFVLGAVPDVEAAVALLHDALRPGGSVFVGDMAFGPGPVGRAVRWFYRWYVTGNGEDVAAAVGRHFTDVEPVIDPKGRRLVLEDGRSWPPWTMLFARRR